MEEITLKQIFKDNIEILLTKKQAKKITDKDIDKMVKDMIDCDDFNDILINMITNFNK